MTDQTMGWIDIDLEQDGKRSGWVHMPHSVNSNAWGCVRLPVSVIKNGSGPTALLMAGNHGDEFEGQVGLPKLYRKLQAEDLSGRLIFLPAANYPACEAGERVSPVDSANLNRAFPGKANGSLTERIAHFIESVLFPMSDWHVDIHSGGKSDDFIPVIGAYLGDDEVKNAAAVEGVKLLGMPFYSVNKITAARASFASAAATGRGVISVGGEFGGGGGLTDFGLKIIEEGLPRLLRHIGILKQSIPVAALHTEPLRLRPVPPSKFPYAPCNGIFQSYVSLRDTVRAGDLCGLVHRIDDLRAEPVEIRFATDGLVASIRHLRIVHPGVCLAVLSMVDSC